MANWSELLPDLLEVITSHLSLSDFTRFSAVCKPWRFAAKQRKSALASELPWVVLTEDPETGKRKLFNMSEKRHYYIDIPELRGGYCVGSSFGWLFIVSPKIEVYLVNPFTGEHYVFPSVPFYLEDLDREQAVDGETTYENHGELSNWKLEQLQKISIFRTVLTDDPKTCKNFTAIINIAGLCKMAFCRPGDSKWTVYVDNCDVLDVISYKGSIYAVGGCNSLYAVDIGPEPKMKWIEPSVRECTMGESKYLVDFFGEHLLFVNRQQVPYNSEVLVGEHDDTIEELLNRDNHYDYTSSHYVAAFFTVFELDLENKKWRKWNDLRGNAIFLGTNRAIAIRPSEVPDCKADCIYFTSCSSDVLASNDYGYDDLGVYNLIENSMEKFYDHHIPTTSMPTWLVPNL